jgi:hypothetical protein
MRVVTAVAVAVVAVTAAVAVVNGFDMSETVLLNAHGAIDRDA